MPPKRPFGPSAPGLLTTWPYPIAAAELGGQEAENGVVHSTHVTLARLPPPKVIASASASSGDLGNSFLL